MIIAGPLKRDKQLLEAIIREAKGESVVVCGWNHQLLDDVQAHQQLVEQLRTDAAYRADASETWNVHRYALSDQFNDDNTSEAKKRADQYVMHCTAALRTWLRGMSELGSIATAYNTSIVLVPGPLDTSQEKLAGIAAYIQEGQRDQRAVMKEFLDVLNECKKETLFDGRHLTYLNIKTADISGITVKGIGGVISPTADAPTIFQEDTLRYMAQPNDRLEDLVKVFQQQADVTLLLQDPPENIKDLEDAEQQAWRVVNDFLKRDERTARLLAFQRQNRLVLQHILKKGDGLRRGLLMLSADYCNLNVLIEEEPVAAQPQATPAPEPAVIAPTRLGYWARFKRWYQQRKNRRAEERQRHAQERAARTAAREPPQKRFYAKLYEKVHDWYARKDAKAKRSLWKKAGITAAGLMAAAGLAYLLTRPAREATVTKATVIKATFTMTYEGKDWVLPAAFEDKVLYFMQTADQASIDSKLIEADIADGKQDYIIKNIGVAKLNPE